MKQRLHLVTPTGPSATRLEAGVDDQQRREVEHVEGEHADERTGHERR